MKKNLFILFLIVMVSTIIQAQTVTKTKYSSIKTTNLQPIPVETQTPPPPPAPKSGKMESTGSNLNTSGSIYALTSVRVNIRTGNDNKEFPSEVGVMLRNRSNDGGWIMQQLPQNMRNEMPSNSNTEFGLEKMTNPFPDCMKLESIQKEGLALRIYYIPNLLTDAWKIEGVTITLVFKDQNGMPHPTYGNKTIICNNVTGFLNTFDHILMCYIDGQFVPTTSSFQQ